MLTFLGIVLWMGLDKKPKLRNYWSKKNIYSSSLSKCMSRNRFEAILTYLHVSNNEIVPTDSNDRLIKIRPLISALNVKFQEAMNPFEDICIDETMVPFRGRVKFRQYVPSKRHRYGIKLYKLCLIGGYTWNVKVCAGKEHIPRGQSASSKTVMELVEPLLGEGRTLCTDNFYTSVQLAHELNENETHLVGTLRKKRKLNSKNVEKKALNKGEMIVKESNTGVIIGKWKDKREVMFLTTKEIPVMTESTNKTNKRGTTTNKPSTVLTYNQAKSFIDVSDQLASYGTSVRRGVKWYRKLMFELLTNTSVVNAHSVYKSTVLSPKDIVTFREELVTYLLETRQKPTMEHENLTRTDHKLTSLENQPRGRCSSCYEKLKSWEGRIQASKRTPQVRMKCTGCPQKFMCMDCFFTKHRCSKK
uniref:PiggyBac transposable element-derived protein domain-containing protein n=1 Tax=Graphocephala atropunctata TaxID=36148 RepID=A0A1B6MQT6_9HEMI